MRHEFILTVDDIGVMSYYVFLDNMNIYIICIFTIHMYIYISESRSRSGSEWRSDCGKMIILIFNSSEARYRY